MYHAIVGVVLLASFFVHARPEYRRSLGNVGEAILTALLYPLALPAVIACGGLHNDCGDGALVVVAIPVFLLTLVAAGSGARPVARRVSRRSGGRRDAGGRSAR